MAGRGDAICKTAIVLPGDCTDSLRLHVAQGNLVTTDSKEACALAGVSARTLQVWTRDGKLHPKRATRSHVRYSRNELEAFLGYPLEA